MATYGEELKDQYDRIGGHTQHCIAFLGDIREFINARASLEREYAQKLATIVRKAHTARSRGPGQYLTGGSDPVKPVEDHEQNSLYSQFGHFLDGALAMADAHASLGDALDLQIAGALKTLERRKEESRKRHYDFAKRVIEERDHAYSSRSKDQDRYYRACQDLEAARARQERALDAAEAAGEGGQGKAHSAQLRYAKDFVEMANCKNWYLTSIQVANRQKAAYYHEDIPRMSNAMQKLEITAAKRLVNLLRESINLQQSLVKSHQTQLSHQTSALDKIDSVGDAEIFIRYNQRRFQEPSNWSFEPCPVWHDTPAMIVETDPKIFLQNRLVKCRKRLQEVEAQVKSRTAEEAGLKNLLEAYDQNPAKGDVDDVHESLLESSRQLLLVESLARSLETESATIKQALGSDTGTEQPHDLKPTSFVAPTKCAICNHSIWGLSKNGETCQSCGVSVHSKCKERLPMNCSFVQKEKDAGRRVISTGSTTNSPAARSSIDGSVSNLSVSSNEERPGSIAGPKRRAAPPVPKANGTAGSGAASILFAFRAEGPQEISVTEGESVRVLEADNGSGWVTIRSGFGSGKVPAWAVATPTTASANVAASAVPEEEQGQVSFAFEAGGSGEMTVAVGDRVVILKDDGSGWIRCRRLDSSQAQGLVPSWAVQRT